MYNNADELIKNEIDNEFMKQVYYGIENGIEIYKELLGNNLELFGNSLSSNVLPRLVSFCINSQFSPEVYVSKSGFKSYIKKTNSFGATIVVLEKKNLVLHVTKVSVGNHLPGKAKYKLELAQNNNFDELQLKINLENENSKENIISQNYGIISYSLNKDYTVSSIELVIPDKYFTNYLSKLNIKEKVEMFKNENTDKQNRKTLITLKEQIKENPEILENISGEK